MVSSLENEKHIHVVMCGDFNYKEINCDTWDVDMAEDHTSHSFVKVIRDRFLHQHVDFYTRFQTRQRPTTFDLVFTNEEY